MALPYGLTYVNAAAGTLTLNSEAPDHTTPDGISTTGRVGDWNQSPFSVLTEQSTDGLERVATAVQFAAGVLTVEVKITPIAGTALVDYLDQVSDVLAPMLYVGGRREPNTGYLYASRFTAGGVATADVWRMPVTPLPFSPEKATGTGQGFYLHSIGFTPNGPWEADPLTANDKVLKAAAAAAWLTFTVANEAPGGNYETPPEWEFDGPASGTIGTIRIENLTTSEILEFGGLSLGAGQTLTITSDFLLKTAYIGSTNVFKGITQPSTFFTLQPALNNLRFTKDVSNQSEVRVSYRKRRTGIGLY